MAHHQRLRPAKRYSDLPASSHNFDNVPVRLIHAAWNALFSREPEQISLRELAAEVGVSQPAAYNHFQDKHALFASVADAGLGTLASHVELLIPADSDSVKGILRGLCDAWISFGKKRPRHFALMFSIDFMDPARFPEITARRDRLTRFLEVVVEQELGFKPKPGQGQILHALLHGAASIAASGGPDVPVAAVLEAIQLHLAGLKDKHR